MLLAALAAALLVGLACGGGGESTLAEYFTQLDAVTKDVDKQIADLQSKYANAFQQTADTQSYLNEYVPTVKDGIDRLAKIDPAQQTAEPHKEFVAAGRDFLTRIEAAAARVSQVQNDADLQPALKQLNDDQDLTSASDRFDKACRALQKIADDNKIQIDLQCTAAPSDTATPGATR